MKTRLLIGGLVVAVIASLGLSYVQFQDGRADAVRSGQVKTGRIAELGEFRWPNAWRREPTQHGDERAGVLLRLRRSDPAATFLLRRITGKLENSFSVKELAGESEKALKEGIRDLTIIENRQITRDGFGVVSIDYIQGNSPESFRARLLVVPTPDRTFYLTFRSPVNGYADVENEFDEVSEAFFEAL